MLQGEHSAILSTFIKLPFVIQIFVLSIFELPFYTGFTVNASHRRAVKVQKCMYNGESNCSHIQRMKGDEWYDFDSCAFMFNPFF